MRAWCALGLLALLSLASPALAVDAVAPGGAVGAHAATSASGMPEAQARAVGNDATAAPEVFHGWLLVHADGRTLRLDNACGDSGAALGCDVVPSLDHVAQPAGCWKTHGVSGGLTTDALACSAFHEQVSAGLAQGSAVHDAVACALEHCVLLGVVDTDGRTCLDASQDLMRLAADLPPPCWKP